MLKPNKVVLFTFNLEPNVPIVKYTWLLLAKPRFRKVNIVIEGKEDRVFKRNIFPAANELSAIEVDSSAKLGF